MLPDGREVKLKSKIYSGYIINRDIFEYDMAARAARKGAVIRLKSNVQELILKENGSRRRAGAWRPGRRGQYDAGVVIAADGVESRIARQMGVGTALKPEDIEPCVQITASNVRLPEKALYLYVGFCYAPGGYAWVFPKANHCANIGLGINGKYSRVSRPVSAYMENFMQRFFPDASVQRYVSGGVPVSTNLKPLTKKNLLIVGDAGRMVNPLNGGGITHAIYSGRQAGRTAAGTCEAPEKAGKIFLAVRKEHSEKVREKPRTSIPYQGCRGSAS
ncbi:MAG: NAD(P)/FAD-dependent oxidoreductase [Candidatus Marinimicrobia bacterium]|nr:NAD(P)/FAD-dependent oxidoreductase [Candidatus Neomarinimicrobiota bacterium]